MELSFIIFFVGCVLVTGALLAVTPWLMPKTECFAVTVPEGARRDPRLAALRRRYALAMGAATLVCAASLVPFAASGPGALDADPAPLVGALLFATLVPVALSFALMLRFRRRVRAIKAAEGWAAPRPQAAAVVVEDDLPRPLSLAWSLLYVPIVLATVVAGVALWPSIPDQIPMHASFSGVVNSWAPKTVGSVFFPVWVQLFMVVTFMFCHWSILRSKRPAGVGAPVTSALAYGLFARAESVLLLVSGLIITAAVGAAFTLSTAGIITLGVAAAIVLAAVVPILAGSAAISVVYGQAGSRLFRRMEAAGVADAPAGTAMPADDDEHWKLGIFYVNRDDASLFLPERFGVGWTLNLGRPAAWGIIAGCVAVTAVFLVVVFVALG